MLISSDEGEVWKTPATLFRNERLFRPSFSLDDCKAWSRPFFHNPNPAPSSHSPAPVNLPRIAKNPERIAWADQRGEGAGVKQ